MKTTKGPSLLSEYSGGADNKVDFVLGSGVDSSEGAMVLSAISPGD